MVDVDRTMKRARRYWYEDGLTEVAAGCIFMAIALLFYAETLAKAGMVPIGLSAFGLPVVVIGSMLISRWAVAAAKARITYPRTGYVAYRTPSGRHRMATSALALVISFSVVLFLSKSPQSMSLSWIMVMQGAAIAIFMAYMGLKVGLTRFVLLAALSLVCGAAVAVSGLTDSEGETAYYGLMGVGLLVSGAVTLVQYLRLNRPQVGGR